VRRSWAQNAYRLMGKLHHPADVNKVFRYLTLPAPEMLDIRSLRSACIERGYKLKFVGFNAAQRGSATEKQLTLAQSQLRSQDWIEESSQILWHRLENLAASRNPIAYQSAIEHGPYHAINFDLCDNIARKIGDSPTTLDALGKLVQLQTSKCNHDWLLFIATRVEKATLAPECVDAFMTAIQSNRAASEEFAHALEEMLGQNWDDTQRALAMPAELSDELFKDMLCVGIGKWLLRYLNTANPPHRLRMMTGYYYSVEEGKPDMLSLVYRCEVAQLAAQDPTQLVCAQGGQTSDDAAEVELALRVVEKTRYLVDLDGYVSGDDGLCDSLIEETISLLREASYDEATLSQYRSFALGE